MACPYAQGQVTFMVSRPVYLRRVITTKSSRVLRIEAVSVVTVKNYALWNITACSLVDIYYGTLRHIPKDIVLFMGD
jgi:small-conductance mechanosensitive channel